MITRADAGLRPPKRTPLKMRESIGVFVHHTAGRNPYKGKAPQVWRGVQRYHMNPKPNGRGWVDIGYSFGFTDRGLILEGRGWGIHGAHTRKHNGDHHGFVYLGNGGDRPTEKAMDALAWLIAEHDRRYGVGTVRCHRNVSTTKCPGDWLYALVMERWNGRQE